MWGYIIIGLIVGGSIYPPIIQIAAWGVFGVIVIIMVANIFLPEYLFWPKESRERYKRMQKEKKQGSSK